MKRRQLHIVGLVAALATSCMMQGTSYLRSPLSLWRGVFHYPLAPIEPENDWQVEIMGALYGRSADQAYSSSKCCPDLTQMLTDHTTRCTKPLSILFFNKTDFTIAQAFGSGPLFNTGIPAFTFDVVSPRIEYIEYGAIGTLHAFHKFNDDSWRFGFRAILPFSVIEVDQRRGCDFEEPVPPLNGTTFVRQERPGVNVNDPINVTTYAYRMDFLSTLLQTNGMPMVQYAGGGVQVGGQEIASANAGSTKVAVTPATATGFPQLIDTIPNDTLNPRFVSTATEVTAGLPLPANGSTVAGNRYFFKQGTAYGPALGIDATAQSKLFLVPVGRGSADITPEADNVFNAVQDVLALLEESGLNSATNALLQRCCIDLCNSSRNLGIGDLDLEVYAWNMGRRGFGGLVTGFRFPTGKKAKNPRHVYEQSIGNNGHFEYRAGAEFGWHPLNWFAFKGDVIYQYVFKANEKKAAPFAGATVVNIGPIINACVQWDYVVAHADLNFFHPRNPNLGCLFGYELYDKRSDRVCLCQETAINCITGLEQELDPTLLSLHTARTTHKLRFEAFNRFDYWELFGGVSEIVGGKNAMKETEWHIGANVYF